MVLTYCIFLYLLVQEHHWLILNVENVLTKPFQIKPFLYSANYTQSKFPACIPKLGNMFCFDTKYNPEVYLRLLMHFLCDSCQSSGLQEVTAGTNTSDSECGPRNIHVFTVALPVVLLVVVSILIASILILSKFSHLSDKTAFLIHM